MKQTESDAGLWSFDLEAEWPTQAGINGWGLTSQGTLDLTAAYGDVDGDHVLDWLPPNTKSNNVLNLSTVYGRTWRYLFASQHAPTWAVGLMLVAFFVGLWAVIMTGLYFVSREHSWVPSILGICLGAPRWCQELWAVSGIAAFVPWGGPVTAPCSVAHSGSGSASWTSCRAWVWA
jgi:hypothetical protein